MRGKGDSVSISMGVARLVGVLVLSGPACCLALELLSEDELSGVSGMSGLSTSLATPGITVSSASLKSDSGALAGGIEARGLTLYPYGAPTLTGTYQIDVGSTATTPGIALSAHLNSFRLGGSYSGVPTSGDTGFGLGLPADPARRFGAWTLVSNLDFSLAGQPFFGAPSSTTALNFSLGNAVLLYQQDWYYHSNITLNNLDFSWSMPAATVDADVGGLRIAGDATFHLGFDLLYKFNPDQNMTTVTANDRPLLNLDWSGTLYDSLVYVRAGGVWDTATDAGTSVAFNSAGTSLVNMPAGASGGINLGLRWNYRSSAGASNFTWRLGHAAVDREYLAFGDWRNLESATGPVAGRYGFDMPLVVLDALNAGAATNAGGSLCWGNTMTAAACSSGGGSLLSLLAGTVEGYPAEVNRSGAPLMMQLIRNGNLLAWSNSVLVGSFGNPSLNASYNWGLIYTLANINSNIYFYPGGSESDVAGGSRNNGILADVLFMSQSPNVAWAPDNSTNTNRWTYGSHFMIADTAAGQGIGLLGASFLLAADDTRIWLKNTWAGQASPSNWDGGIDIFSPRTRAELKGLFGGARLPGGWDLVKAANVDLNFEGLWNFRLSPGPAGTDDVLAYSAAIRFRCGNSSNPGCANNAFANSTGSAFASGNGSYISIEEPDRAGVDLRFADMSGDVAWAQGTMQLREADQTGTGKSDLTLSNKLLVGASAAARMNDAAAGAGLGAGGPAGRYFTSNVQFSGNTMLGWAIPAASMYASFTLRPQ